jgi:hypothetical protein
MTLIAFTNTPVGGRAVDRRQAGENDGLPEAVQFFIPR